ncbi:hypothetical protein [Mycobacterium botniense]|uniref:Uncharacterized protein n=1 Tax=Mycobacterium botniense TaxID=84962 RepID=A0A7I9Y286_9MYCO|nr:hypothetical protein [Mycobacterium botniense]GFG76171.1 hypothetical protein MBOT_35360 [Mycobacterium botniense]
MVIQLVLSKCESYPQVYVILRSNSVVGWKEWAVQAVRHVRITAGVAIAAAGLIAVSPWAPAVPVELQQRAVQLTTSAGLLNLGTVGDPLAGLFSGVSAGTYPVIGPTELIANTMGNLSGLEHVAANTVAAVTAPDAELGLRAVIEGLLQLHLTNPVMNPISVLTEGALLALAPLYGPNAAFTGLVGIANNIDAAINSGSSQAVLENLVLAPTTLLNDLVNGYPLTGVEPFSDVLSPQFGLLTNPDSTTNPLATGGIDGLLALQQTLADEMSAAGGANLTTGSLTLLNPGSIDLTVNVDTLLNALAPSGAFTLPITPDQLLNDLAPSGVLTLSVSVDQLLNTAVPSGTLTLPFSLNDLLANATPSGSVTIPISLDQLLSDAAPSGTITVPITPDQILNSIAGSGGSISVPPIAVSTIVSDLGNPTVNVGCFHFVGCISISLAQLVSDAGLSNRSINLPSISDSTVVNDLESALGSAGNQNLSVSVSSLESLLGGVGSQNLSVSTSTLEQLLGSSGSENISLSVSTLEQLLGSAGSQEISIPVSTLESALGSLGSQQISIPLNTLESVVPSTLNLGFTTPAVTGPAVPTYTMDLAHDLVAVLGSIGPVSSALPALLSPDSTLNLVSLAEDATTALGLPLSVTGGELSANLTDIVAVLLSSMLP